jgi:hypothetical protein
MPPNKQFLATVSALAQFIEEANKLTSQKNTENQEIIENPENLENNGGKHHGN